LARGVGVTMGVYFKVYIGTYSSFEAQICRRFSRVKYFRRTTMKKGERNKRTFFFFTSDHSVLGDNLRIDGIFYGLDLERPELSRVQSPEHVHIKRAILFTI
jgi:hypothetical protein